MIREFHLFAGIGGGIYAGDLLGHRCCAGVEIMDYAQRVLKQRQKDGWMRKFPIYPDICKLNGDKFMGKFDVLCGGFPCQAFSPAAHGKNIPEKNLWDEMFRFAKESNAPIVFGENVVLRAINKAKSDLESVGYKVECIRLSNADLGADHQRYRFWLLAVRDQIVFQKVVRHLKHVPKLTGACWESSPEETGDVVPEENDRTDQLLGVGNAQSPLVAATAFRVLVNRHLHSIENKSEVISKDELTRVFEKRKSWIKKVYGNEFGLLHTPTTVANYCCGSMQKHVGCRNYVRVFVDRRNLVGANRQRPMPSDAEYLMGFPIGASYPHSLDYDGIKRWKEAR